MKVHSRKTSLYLNIMMGIGALAVSSVVQADCNLVNHEAQAKKGDLVAYKWMAKHYSLGLCMTVSLSPTKAHYWFDQLLKQAQQNNTLAEKLVGDCYRAGYGAPQSTMQADSWYNKAFLAYTAEAKQGNAGAEEALGQAYYYGYGMPQNNAKAFYWSMKAAKQGNGAAEEWIAEMYASGNVGKFAPVNPAKAIYWDKLAAKQGQVHAMEELGRDYSSDQDGYPLNYKQSFYWYTQAAKRGDSSSQNRVAYAYAEGLGVPVNYAKATYWYKQAIAGKGAFAFAAQHGLRDLSLHPKLFGVKLNGASRSELEPVLAKNKFTPLDGQVGSKWWFDVYNVHGQFQGARKLYVGYTAGGLFAIARYVFPGAKAADGHGIGVWRVIRMMTAQYGTPDVVNGFIDSSDNGSATWNLFYGMKIQVIRTSAVGSEVYLEFIDRKLRAKMNQQMAASVAGDNAAQKKAF